MPDELHQLSLLDSSTATYGWMGTIADFFALSPAEWLHTIAYNYQRLYRKRPTQTQQQAWIDSGEVLRSPFTLLLNRRPTSANWTLIFEYELPREGGRRPDLIILAAGVIWVIEFKQKTTPSSADLDQVAAYGRDLAEYHGGCGNAPVVPLLVLTRRQRSGEIRQGVRVLPPEAIADCLAGGGGAIGGDRSRAVDSGGLCAVADGRAGGATNLSTATIAGDQTGAECRYSRCPCLFKSVDRHGSGSAATALGTDHGRTGSRKTLVGLQVVYQPMPEGVRSAVFLSGNGPLITVLQYALKSRVFVQAVRNFYLHHEVRRQSPPREHVIVFDEAQRAWDAERMGEKYGIDTAAAGAVLRIAGRAPDWCVLVGLIGEGQEIHVGEEEGTEQWNHGLEQTPEPWHVHCAPEQIPYFTAVPPDRLHVQPLLNLTTSLRTHLAEHVQTWVAHLLAGEVAAAATLTASLLADGFTPYLTRDLEAAKQYCRDRYQSQPSKRYGLLASSRARNLAAHGLPNDYRSTVRVNMGAWYIDPPDSPLSCCALEQVVTEFGCQGLELDFPIVGWGNDLLWHDQGWSSPIRQRHVRNPLRLRLNSYRVLLTRGRDGFVIFVPPETAMDRVFEVLAATGIDRIDGKPPE
ncbi:MAG: DUF2075 domain-containing protein [Leptolyngbyaceae cyanobacterium SL_7_1]|nr:DUF2075 domain-containing protein [Leptolyngbyaceae cyanobacterium SL_7_1]